ncbi:MAG: hypothetical protein DCC71_00815 [Proteobacteria bacterium]|nr:MAG: hypothetical protein DCC71_00815 [Pseudomonadota bacterium]
MWTGLLGAAVIAATALAAGDAAAGRGRDGACPDRGRPAPNGRALGVPDHACRPPTTIRMSGTAYTFNTRRGIAGAEIHVDELPERFAVTDANGAWQLEVPIGRDVTPYIVAEGHHTIYLQTFRTGAADIEQVNFQTPEESVYNLLYLLIQSYIGRPPFEDGCVIVSTVSDPAVVGMTFDEFIHFAPHGVAGAAVYGEPPLPEPIYFNDAVFPDIDQELTSGDGGVLVANVPVGVYEVFATHPDYEFASFTATCEQDRVINANPPWGLHGIP